MRPIWKGQISFGLINIPVELFSVEKSRKMAFKLVDKRNKAKIRYERINEETGKEVPWEQIAKAYEIKKKGLILMSEEDFKRAAVENTQTFEIEDFVERDSVETVYYEKPYYLEPSKQGKKGYILLREVLKKTGKIAIGKVVIRTKQYLAALIGEEDGLVLNLLRFYQDLRSADEFDFPKGSLKENKINTKEIEMAEKLVQSMTVKWNPKKYRDTYEDQLLHFIEKKAKMHKIPLPEKEKEEAPKKTAQVVDFMDLLKKSLKTKSTKKSARKKAAIRKRA